MSKPPARWIRRLLLLPLMLAVQSCSTSGPVTSDYCSLFSPIRVSRQDVLTDGTVEQILKANETFDRVCKG